MVDIEEYQQNACLKISFQNPAIINSQNQFKSSYQRCSVRKVVLRNFAKCTGKRLCQSLFFKKVTGLRPATEAELKLKRF